MSCPLIPQCGRCAAPLLISLLEEPSLTIPARKEKDPGLFVQVTEWPSRQ